jgi:hypothetical protein
VGMAETRFRKRVPCRVWVGESSYSGVVLNLSRQGMFVQTCAGMKAGDSIDLRLRGEIDVQAQVVWRRRVPPVLRNSAEGGVGLQIIGAPEGYFHLLAEAAGIQA